MNMTVYGATIVARLAAAERRTLGHYTVRAITTPQAGPLDEEDWRVLDRVEGLVAREEGRVGYTRRPRQRERGCR